MLPQVVSSDDQALVSQETPRAHPVDVYLATLAPGSWRTIRGSLDEIARIVSPAPAADAYALPWQDIRWPHAVAIRAHLSERHAHSTTNKMLSALRGVLKACWRLSLMTAEDYHLAASIEPVRGERLPAGRNITPGELTALMDACAEDHSPIGRRDAALFALLYVCGLRREEVGSLDLADYDTATQGIRLVGKRNKQRMVYVGDSGAQAALADWLALRGDAPGPLLVAIHKGWRITSQRLRPQTVYSLVCLRATQAQIPKTSPHDFRRTFVSDLLDRGADIAVVQKLAGHTNITTTALYDRRPEEAKKRASALLHVPYRPHVA